MDDQSEIEIISLTRSWDREKAENVYTAKFSDATTYTGNGECAVRTASYYGVYIGYVRDESEQSNG